MRLFVFLLPLATLAQDAGESRMQQAIYSAPASQENLDKYPANFVGIDSEKDTTASIFSVVSAGRGNRITRGADFSSISGGYSNSVYGSYSSVGGGLSNRVLSNFAVVLGGFQGKASGRFSAVLGGSQNTAAGKWSLASGFRAKAMPDYSAAFGFKENWSCSPTKKSEFRICAETIVLDGIVSNAEGSSIATGDTVDKVLLPGVDELVRNSDSTISRVTTQLEQLKKTFCMATNDGTMTDMCGSIGPADGQKHSLAYAIETVEYVKGMVDQITSVDDCVDVNCANGGTCADAGYRNFVCNCAAGWGGKYCEADAKDCMEDSCSGHGICIEDNEVHFGKGTFSCDCIGLWKGDEKCSTCVAGHYADEDKCTLCKPIKNCAEEKCTSATSSTCEACDTGFFVRKGEDGDSCEVCKNLKCPAGKIRVGTCSGITNDFSCIPNPAALLDEKGSAMESWLAESGRKLGNEIYNAAKHGYTAKAFHDKVDGQNYLLAVIKTKSGGYIFGGFSGETPWSSTGGYQQSAGAWMYFLNTRRSQGNKWQWNTQLKPDKALFFSSAHSFTMGDGHDLYLDMAKRDRSYCKVTSTYLPSAGGNDYKGEDLVGANFEPAEFIIYATTAMPKLNWLGVASSLIRTSPIISWLSAIGRLIGPVLYDNQRDGWGARNFHKAVDGSTNTLLVVKTQDGYVFGGYTGNLRHSGATSGYVQMPSNTPESDRPWLYTLKTRIEAADFKQMRILPTNDYNNALMNRNDYMWTQGDGHDLYIGSTRDRSYVKWGVQYDFPGGDKMLTGEKVVGRSDGTSEMFYPETVLVYSTVARDVVEPTETGLDD